MLGGSRRRSMDEMRARQEEQQRPQGHSSGSPLRSERGGTIISDNVVSKIAGIAAQEVEGIQVGGVTARAVGAFLDRVTSGGANPRRLGGGRRGRGRSR